MENRDWIEMFRVIPEAQHNQLVLVLLNGSEISLDTLFRFESNYVVARGRVGGTTDENRAFFIPYQQMLYYRLERIVKLEELTDIYEGQPPAVAAPDVTETPLAAPAPSPTAVNPLVPVTAPANNGTPAAPVDPNATRNALLERIRAARATQLSGDRQKSKQET